MGKPLLTDEIIERANRGDDIFGPPLQDDEETKILSFSSQNNRYSRSRDHGFKLNKILFAVIFLLILLVLAMRFI